MINLEKKDRDNDKGIFSVCKIMQSAIHCHFCYVPSGLTTEEILHKDLKIVCGDSLKVAMSSVTADIMVSEWWEEGTGYSWYA